MGRKRLSIEDVKTSKSIRIPNKLWSFLQDLAKNEDSTITLEIQKLIEKEKGKMRK